jgi:hypothetical protein
MNEGISVKPNRDMNELQRLKAKIESARNSLRRLFKEWLKSVGETNYYWMEEGECMEEREWIAVTNWNES